MRKNGYYWIRRGDDWEPTLWLDGRWFFNQGPEGEWCGGDNYTTEICEIRLVPPSEVEN
jgi:hypothetical protein